MLIKILNRIIICMNIVNQFCKPSQYWYPKRVRIYITDLKDPTIGLCSFSYPSAFDITIDRSEFSKFSVPERFQLVAHEMRHCLFRVGHSDDPNNYMAPEFIHIDKDVLAEQVVEDIANSCQ